MTTIHPRSSALPVSNPTDLVWLNALPQHWEARKLKYCLAVNESTLPETTDPDFKFRYIEIGAVNSEGLVERPAIIQFSAAPSRARRVIKGGDTIVSTVRTYLKAVWHAEEPEKDLICSTGFAVLTPKRGTVPKFASYVARSAPFTDQMTAESVGIAYPAITESKLGDLRICLPPCEEQAAIVRYLDHADEKIQAYISAKEKLIALLEEQRQAVIHQSVTRGLDPNINLKPSALEWLGEVPEHWEVTTAKRKYIIQIGKMLQPSPKTEDDKEVQYLRALNIQWENLVTHDIATMWASSEEIAQLQVQPTDLLVCEGGAGAGNSTIVEDVPEGIIIQNSVHRVRARKASSNKFLLYILKTSADLGWLEVLNNKATIPHFTKEKFETFLIALPPIWEQEAIIEHLNKSKQSIDEATDRARRQIELMQEYRTRLIADVVTGKLDVREAAEDLPQLEPTDITN